MKNLKIQILLLVIIFTLSFPSNTSGQNITFGIKPENPNIGYFEFTMQPGDTKEDAIIILNHSDRRQNIRVESVDAFTADGGGIAYEFGKNTNAKKWISIDGDGVYELGGSRIQRLAFKISVPPDTPPGDYVFGLLSAVEGEIDSGPSATNSSGSSFGVKVVSQVGLAIIVRIPGEKECSLEITDLNDSIQSARWNLKYTIRNNANNHFYADGLIKIIDMSTEKEIINQKLMIGYIVPKTEFSLNQYLDLPENGNYEVNVEMIDKDNPSCRMKYSRNVIVGEEISDIYFAQSTKIASARATNTPAPMPTETTDISTPVAFRGSNLPDWVLIGTFTLFLISIGLVVYAINIMKQRK